MHEDNSSFTRTSRVIYLENYPGNPLSEIEILKGERKRGKKSVVLYIRLRRSVMISNNFCRCFISNSTEPLEVEEEQAIQ